MTDETAPKAAENENAENFALKTSLGRRIRRTLTVLALLVLLTWIFGRTGVLHKLETIVTDAEMRMNPPPTDSAVVLVNIDDDDYRSLFGSSSPLDPVQIQKLISDIAKGEPAVIGIDIDTSAARFAKEFRFQNWTPHIVWERELRDVPEEATGYEQLDPLPILGGQKEIDPAKNSSGIPLLLDDAEDRTTRRYRRLLVTRFGPLSSFPWAVAKAYLQTDGTDGSSGNHCRDDKPAELSSRVESPEDLVIRYSGDRNGSHRLRFSAKKLTERSEQWPQASPICGKILLLGGSYLGQNKHDTPIGQLTGLEVMANVVVDNIFAVLDGRQPPNCWNPEIYSAPR